MLLNELLFSHFRLLSRSRCILISHIHFRFTCNNNSMASSSIIGLDACITNVLMDIRKYLDVESTVRLSQTCRTFHNLLTEDEDDQYPKIKVSYFTFGDSSLWRDNRGRHIQESSVTKGVKIRSLATDVLPNIHWQSLKRIEFRHR